MRYIQIILVCSVAGCGGAAVTDAVAVTSDPPLQVGAPDTVTTLSPVVDEIRHITLSLDETESEYNVVLDGLSDTTVGLNGAVATRHMGQLIGEVALPENFPITATYTGNNVQAVIADGATRLYNFDSGRARVTIGPNNILTLDQFSGILIAENTQSGIAVDTQDITLKWTGFSVCEGDHFCNGTLAINGDDISNKVLSASATSSAKATFFGGNAQAFGGMIYINDPNRLNVMADFIADRD